jgi:hypothetical protein
MIDIMPRPRPPHLHRETTRHRKSVWYVRIGKGKRVRIPGEYGSPEFMAAYDDAISRAMQAGPIEWARGRLLCLGARALPAVSSLGVTIHRHPAPARSHFPPRREDARDITVLGMEARRHRGRAG